MNCSFRKVFVFGLCVVVALLLASPIQGEEGKKDKVKLTGAEIKELIAKPGTIMFGITHRTNSVWIIEGLENGKRNVFWKSLENPNRWGTDIGTLKVVGDQACTKWSFGPESCFDIYRVSEDKYEYWLGGLYATSYIGQREYVETKKDKVKLTGAELKENDSQYGVYAGIGHKYNNVWIIIRPSSGKLVLYWRSLNKPCLSSSAIGTSEIVEDQGCTTYPWGRNCFDYYRIGEDKYESWLYGSIDSTYYRLK